MRRALSKVGIDTKSKEAAYAELMTVAKKLYIDGKITIEKIWELFESPKPDALRFTAEVSSEDLKRRLMIELSRQ